MYDKKKLKWKKFVVSCLYVIFVFANLGEFFVSKNTLTTHSEDVRGFKEFYAQDHLPEIDRQFDAFVHNESRNAKSKGLLVVSRKRESAERFSRPQAKEFVSEVAEGSKEWF